MVHFWGDGIAQSLFSKFTVYQSLESTCIGLIGRKCFSDMPIQLAATNCLHHRPPCSLNNEYWLSVYQITTKNIYCRGKCQNMRKNMRYAHFAKICEKCSKVPNMRQSHIRVFLTCLGSDMLIIHTACEYNIVWYKIIMIICSANSKVLTESSTGSSSSNKVRTMLSIQVETIDFDTQACVLRVKGRNVEENEYVKVCSINRCFVVYSCRYCSWPVNGINWNMQVGNFLILFRSYSCCRVYSGFLSSICQCASAAFVTVTAINELISIFCCSILWCCVIHYSSYSLVFDCRLNT